VLALTALGTLPASAAAGASSGGGGTAAHASRGRWTPAHATRGRWTPAHASRTVRVNDTGYLHLMHASGEVLEEAGAISGTLPGTASVRLDVGAETVTASFTIHVRGGGSIAGTGRAKIGSPGRYTSFAGTLTVTSGSGRFARADGAGKLYGVIERKSDKLTVQTREGTLDY
jgi:hypothetical protein